MFFSIQGLTGAIPRPPGAPQEQNKETIITFSIFIESQTEKTSQDGVDHVIYYTLDQILLLSDTRVYHILYPFDTSDHMYNYSFEHSLAIFIALTAKLPEIIIRMGPKLDWQGGT